MQDIGVQIAKELSLRATQVNNTIKLLDQGGTIPFISRYRKEVTEGLNEVEIGQIKIALERILELNKRRIAIQKSLNELGIDDDELLQKIKAASTLVAIEDLYLPYKPKRKTRASIARANGLEPLAKMIMAQREGDPEQMALRFVKGEVKSVDEALQGGRDIIAEWMSESGVVRSRIRSLFQRKAIIKSRAIKGKEETGEKFKDYFKYEEPLSKIKSHRVLALRRGEDEGFIKFSIEPVKSDGIAEVESVFDKGQSAASTQIKLAANDAYIRLLKPSIENEFRAVLKEDADADAIKVFATNLKQLLMGAPLGAKRTLALDPGFRSGCKVVCLDEKGDLKHNETIYPHAPKNQSSQASKKIVTLVNMYKIEAIAIGNGTACRETENFIQRIKFPKDVLVFTVSEAGASIYSASQVARDEFPQYDVTVRGSVSIGRRLMDPLAELVKLDPKSIGVGQYQHDVNQKMLQDSLDVVVESCVNQVGVSLNTASKHLLAHVSGLGPQLAQNIIDYRTENGNFGSREELKKVKRMGDLAFQQSAAFLRIENEKSPLDNSAVHPESYAVVAKMAKDLKIKLSELIGNHELIGEIDLSKYVSDKIGLPTLEDIRNELIKPGRDPRKKAKLFEFDKSIRDLNDLEVGMELPGIITNITNFGCFVDVGVKQDGLVHISELADEYISNPADYVSLHQHVKVKVKTVDVARKRVGFSMKGLN